MAAQACPDEPVSKNPWRLLHKGINRNQLIAAVEALSEAGWTSLPAEQQHDSLAILHKWHPNYGTDMLMSRALLLQATRLLPAATKEEKEAAKLQARIQKVLRAQPDKISGRHMLVSSMIQICTGKKDEWGSELSEVYENDLQQMH